MPKGRKTTPRKVKALIGKRDRNPNPDEPIPMGGLPACPEWLSDGAKEAWFRLASAMSGMGVGTSADAMVLEVLAEAYARLRVARDEIEEWGITLASPQGRKKNPAVTVANECERLIVSLAAEFGLTPSSRARISVGGAKKDKLEAFLSVAAPSAS